jgi:hypothetical protein
MGRAGLYVFLRLRRRRLESLEILSLITNRREYSPPVREISRKFHGDVWGFVLFSLSRRERLRRELPLRPWGSSRVYLKLKLKDYIRARLIFFFPFSRELYELQPQRFSVLFMGKSTSKYGKIHVKIWENPRQNMGKSTSKYMENIYLSHIIL